MELVTMMDPADHADRDHTAGTVTRRCSIFRLADS